MSEDRSRPEPASLLRPTWFEIDLDAIGHNLRQLPRGNTVRRTGRSFRPRSVHRTRSGQEGAVLRGRGWPGRRRVRAVPLTGSLGHELDRSERNPRADLQRHG